MAVINNSYLTTGANTITLNDAYSRISGRPLDASSLYYSLSDAQTYAQSNPYAYVGQIIAVVNQTESTVKVFVIANTAGELQEVGSGTGSAMIFVDTVAALKTEGTPPAGVPDNLTVGQQAFVSADRKIYFLTSVGDTAPTSYNWESQASDAPVWETSNGSDSSLNGKKVAFKYVHVMGDEYDISNYNEEGKLYYVTVEDPAAGGSLEPPSTTTQHIIFEGIDYSSSIVNLGTVSDLNTFTADRIVENALYIYSISRAASSESGKESGYYEGINIAIPQKVEGSLKLLPLIPNIITDLDATALSPDDSGLPTVNFVLSRISELSTAIEQKVEDSITYANGELSIGIVNPTNPTKVPLTGVANNPTYDSENLKLTIPVYGGSDVVVDIPKDNFVTGGDYYETYPEGATGDDAQHNVIVLTFRNQTAPVIIPAESLVNVYTPFNTGNTVAVNIEGSQISANVIIDPTSDKAITSTTSGIKLDLSGKMDVIADATGGKLAITNNNGEVSESDFVVKSTGSLSTMSENDIPVATVIAAAINAVQSTLSQGKLDKLSGTETDTGKLVVVGEDGTSITFGTLTIQEIQNALDNKVDKVMGVTDDVVLFGANGAIKDSGKKIGGATLAATPDANTLATEAAVKEAAKLTWIEL